MWLRAIGACSVLIGAAACSPTHDWRVVRPEGSGFETLFPCRAAYEERAVRLAGADVTAGLHACTAGGVTYAVLTVTMPDPSTVPRALEDLAASSRRNIAAAEAAAVAASVPGATSQPRSLTLEGKLPDGSRVAMRSVVAARDVVVIQSSMIGAALDANHVETFFESQRFGSR